MEFNRFITLCVFFIVGFLFFHIYVVESCNEVVCASIVSKCQLTQSCKCELKNCSCCKECLKCLGKEYYEECCSCVELCPRPNDTRSALSKKSNVEDFDGSPELFEALVSGTDEEYDWSTFTFQVDFDTLLSGPKLEKDFKYLKSNDKGLDEGLKQRENTKTMNCTVIYWDQCTSWNKCKQSCQTTGASSYRWFHDGCCECVGYTCINYGINESRCRDCPDSKDLQDDFDETIEDDMKDFGDGKGPFDSSVDNHF